MKFLFPRAGLVFFSCILSCCVLFSTAYATDRDKNKDKDIIKEEILNDIEKKYSDKSFEARFTQISTLAALDITEKAIGKAFFSHPGKMRWEYIKPGRHEIITNGKSLWIFRPEENQVMIGDASKFFKSGTGGAFLSDISLVRKNYTISVKEVTSDYVEIDLLSKQKESDISLISIRISKKNSEIIRVLTQNAYNDTTLFKFSDIQFKEIDPEVFEFIPSEKLNIIEMD